MVSALSGESKLWGNSHKKGAGKLVGNFELNPLKGDQSGRGPTFFWPLRETMLNFNFMNRVNKTNWKYKIFNICSRTTLKETFTAKYNDVLLRKPSVRFTPLSKTKSIPAPVIWKSPPPSPRESDRLLLVYMLWFNFILGWNFIFLCFGVR